jgi:hypothetical protein
MLKRAWYVIVAGWVLLFLWMGSFEPENMQTVHFSVVAFGPLAVPTVLRWFFQFITTGSVAKLRLRAVAYWRD